MRIREHISLKRLTTLKIGGVARYFCRVRNEHELQTALQFSKREKMQLIILGGGSNVLLSDGEINALVVKVDIRGVEWISYSPLEKGARPNDGSVGRALPSSAGGMLSPHFVKEVTTLVPHFFGKAGDTNFANVDDTELVVAGAGESWDGLVAASVKRGLWGIENLSGIPGTVGAA